MSDTDAPVFVYTTFDGQEDALAVASELVTRGLAACANIFPGMISVYEWQGDIEQAQELAMIVKTRAGRADEVVAAILNLHPYDEPAALVIPLSGGSESFIAWICAQTGG